MGPGLIVVCVSQQILTEFVVTVSLLVPNDPRVDDERRYPLVLIFHQSSKHGRFAHNNRHNVAVICAKDLILRVKWDPRFFLMKNPDWLSSCLPKSPLTLHDERKEFPTHELSPYRVVEVVRVCRQFSHCADEFLRKGFGAVFCV